MWRYVGKETADLIEYKRRIELDTSDDEEEEQYNLVAYVADVSPAGLVPPNTPCFVNISDHEIPEYLQPISSLVNVNVRTVSNWLVG
jgi:hypothetical protein